MLDELRNWAPLLDGWGYLSGKTSIIPNGAEKIRHGLGNK